MENQTGAPSSTFKVSPQEKKLILAYREADDRVKSAVNLLLLKADGLELSDTGSEILASMASGLKEYFGGPAE